MTADQQRPEPLHVAQAARDELNRAAYGFQHPTYGPEELYAWASVLTGCVAALETLTLRAAEDATYAAPDPAGAVGRAAGELDDLRADLAGALARANQARRLLGPAAGGTDQ